MRYILFTLLLFLTACSGSQGTPLSESSSTPPGGFTPISTVPASTTFIYRVGTGTDKIFWASVNLTDGSLTEHPETLLTSGDQPAALAVSPNKQFLFVGKAGTKTVDTYSLDQTTGEPTFIYSYATTVAPIKIVVEPQGRFLYVVEYDRVENYIIAANGSLTWFGGVGIGYGGKDVTIDSTGTYLYKAAIGTGIQSYVISQTNGTMGSASIVSAVGANALRLNPATNNMFGLNYSDGNILNYAIDPGTGAFTFNRFMSTSVIFPYYDLQLNSAGTVAYALGNYLGIVKSFSIAPTTGNFTEVDTATLPAGCNPERLERLSVVDFLYTGCTDNSGVTQVLKMETNGGVSAVSTTTRSGLKVNAIVSVTF